MTTPTPSKTRRPKRRWFQFSLRTLMVLVAVVGFACAWLALTVNAARKQREAVAFIEPLGGEVSYVYKWSFQEPPWLRELVGEEYFHTITSVSFDDTKVTDEGLEHLEGLKSLRVLDLGSTQITDAGLDHLKGLKSLLDLDLRSTKVTDAGLEHLKGLSQLQLLYLGDTNATDEGVKKLQKALPNCKIRRHVSGFF